MIKINLKKLFSFNLNILRKKYQKKIKMFFLFFFFFNAYRGV